jgi:hypothetical protein
MFPTQHGMIRYDKFPFEILINKNDPYGRRQLSFVHELVHAGNRIYKWNLSERDVHEVAIYTLGEVLPALQKYRQIQGETK